MHTIIVTMRDNTSYTIQASFAWEAKSICIEETKWENTLHVFCASIGFDKQGDFA
jgi:hypothetical protein